jgi:hypothetical protein
MGGAVIRDNTASEGGGALFFVMDNNDNCHLPSHPFSLSNPPFVEAPCTLACVSA